VRLDHVAGLLVDELAPQPVTGRAVEGAEGDALGGGGRRDQRHGTGDEGELEIALPVGSGCHAQRSYTVLRPPQPRAYAATRPAHRNSHGTWTRTGLRGGACPGLGQPFTRDRLKKRIIRGK